MNTKFKKVVSAAVIGCFVLTGCARNMGAAVYTSSSAVGKVLEGTVLSAQAITIKDNDKLQDNGMGMLAGGATGAIAGSAIGKGKGSTLGAVGVGIAGAALGAFIQDKLSTQQGMQYVVRIDKKYVRQHNVDVKRKEISVGTKSIDDSIKDSIDMETTTTDLISVVQGNDVIFSAGQRVLIIYNNDRPRLAPAN